MENVTLDFQKDVIEASKTTPIVVDFWAEWCGPCKMLTPILEKLAGEMNGTWKLVKVNTDEHQQLSVEYGISGIPAVKMFSNGKIIADFVGALPEAQVRSWLEENIPTESKNLLEEAKQVLSDGDKTKAQNLFEQVVKADPNNFEARILLAELIFEADGEKAFDLVKDVPAENPLYKNAEAIQTLSRLLNSFESISKQAQESDASHEAWGHYLKGIQALQGHDYDAALKNWIEAVTIDKTVDDEGPRKACIALFSWLGQEHELMQKYHRSFTSALF